MVPLADLVILAWLAAGGPLHIPVAPEVDAPMRTFTVAKPAEAPPVDDNQLTPVAPPRSAKAMNRLTGIAGLGYVQHADFGAEVMASGPVAGLDVQLDGLMTYGHQGARFDHGTVSLSDAERGWRAEAGDLYSDLRGPVRGLRLTWRITDRWQPAVSLDGPRPGSIDRRTLLVYHDRLQVGPVWFDGELAQDGSHFLRSHVTAGRRLDIEASYRRTKDPVPQRDGGVQVGVQIWKGVSVAAGAFRSDRPGDRAEWGTVAVHVPIHRYFGLTIERVFTTSSRSRDVMTGVMVDVHAGSLMFYQRFQMGRADYVTPGLGTLDRRQLQSMAAYRAGPRLDFTMQVASQWMEAGRAQNWLELQTDVRLARRTILQVATPLPGAFEADRVRVRLDQGLPGRFSVLAEYGRPSAYQDLADGTLPPRFKLMLRRTWDVATPAHGGEVRGVVVDYIGRAVPGARVRLGSYTADTDAHGAYVFSQVPRGDYELSLDPNLLPADYAWDGRTRHLSIVPSSRLMSSLTVAPLNAIHGRVFADRNANGRFDPGEGVAGAVVALGERVTATDPDGAYDFYNVMPGNHVVRLDAARLPAPFSEQSSGGLKPAGSESEAQFSRHVELKDDRPATGVDFLVVAKSKTIIWREVK